MGIERVGGVVKQYQINFENKVGRDKIIIHYTASWMLPMGKRQVLYVGHEELARNVICSGLLLTGEVAIQAICQVMKILPSDYQLVEVDFAQPQNKQILNIPDFKRFSEYLKQQDLLQCVPTHREANGIVVDTQFVKELRIG